jgi:hypothetical protein
VTMCDGITSSAFSSSVSHSSSPRGERCIINLWWIIHHESPSHGELNI